MSMPPEFGLPGHKPKLKWALVAVLALVACMASLLLFFVYGTKVAAGDYDKQILGLAIQFGSFGLFAAFVFGLANAGK